MYLYVHTILRSDALNSNVAHYPLNLYNVKYHCKLLDLFSPKIQLDLSSKIKFDINMFEL